MSTRSKRVRECYGRSFCRSCGWKADGCGMLHRKKLQGHVMVQKKVSAIVAGTGFINKDGDPASFIRRYCKDGMPAQLAREPSNPYDTNAITVTLEIGGLLFGKKSAQIGHLKAPLAKRLAPLMDAGVKMRANVVSHFAPRDMEFPRVSLEICYSIG